MPDAPAVPTPPVPTEPPAAAPTPPAPTPTAPAAPADPPAAEPTNPWADPATAEAEIKRLRAENGAARTNAKAQAAEEARKELAASIGKLLDPTATEPTDPAALAEQVTTSQADAKQARVELAVFRNAATAGGDPAALLDSSSFLASLAAVDPSDSAAVSAAIATAIATNPRLGAAAGTPQAPAPNPAQGSTATAGQPSSFDAQIAEATKAGNHQLAIALKQARAASLAKK